MRVRASGPCCQKPTEPTPHHNSSTPKTPKTPQFNQHVIIETNKSTERLFPAVPDVESPEFFRRMDRLVELNTKLVAIGRRVFTFDSLRL
jgi:hypothetical protein